ncbi:MAG: HAD-IIIA family hydrolase [Polyangiaceae bacterium]
MSAGLILDRDGTLIDFHRDADEGVIVSAFHPSQIVLLPGVIEALRLARAHGFLLAIATNQPGVAKGHFGVEAVQRTNQALLDLLSKEGVSIDAVEVCLHHPEAHPRGDASLQIVCSCRKPKPGLLNSIIDRCSLDRVESWMIGDTSGDIDAGRAAGLSTGLVFAPGRCEFCPVRTGCDSNGAGVVPTVVKPSLLEIVRTIMAAREAKH